MASRKRTIIDLTESTSDSDVESVHTQIDDTIYAHQLTNPIQNAGTPLDGLIDPNLGYAVIPYPDEIRDQFNIIQFLREQREFTTVDENQLFVLGGFQAMANPSSYHHPLRRQLMVNIYKYMAPIFSSVIRNSRYREYKYFSMIPDRFGIRRNDQQVGKETWHKDKSLDLERSRHAILFGGWINLDPIGSGKMQYFNCVPGDVVTPEEGQGFYERNLQKKGGFSAEKDFIPQLNARRQRIQVPPGHLVVFNELLTHEVAPGDKKGDFDASKNSYRCYLKWFLSKNKEPYWKRSRMENFFNNQTQIGMSIYQPDAPFYASAHYSTSVDPLLEISQRVIEPIRTFEIRGSKINASNLAERYIGQGNRQAPSEDFIRRGLVDWNIAFPAYSELEKSIYEPKALY